MATSVFASDSDKVVMEDAAIEVIDCNYGQALSHPESPEVRERVARYRWKLGKWAA